MVYVPAHLEEAGIGVKISQLDWEGNEEADRLAKAGTKLHLDFAQLEQKANDIDEFYANAREVQWMIAEISVFRAQRMQIFGSFFTRLGKKGPVKPLQCSLYAAAYAASDL